MILEEETYKKFGYYPSNLKPKSAKKILMACDNCGKIRERQKYSYTPLCKSCSHKKEKIIQKCLLCNEEFETIPSKIKDSRSIFCSRKCQGEWRSKYKRGENAYNWKGGTELRICLECGKEFNFRPSPSKLKDGKGKYCSHSCTAKAMRHNAHPQKTHPEQIFEDLCTKYNLPFHFTGDGRLWIGNANPDFMHNTRKLCTEIYGDYWHSPLLNRNIHNVHVTEGGRRKQLKQEGYKLIVLWESDLLREDAKAFVLNTLKKDIKL